MTKHEILIRIFSKKDEEWPEEIYKEFNQEIRIMPKYLVSTLELLIQGLSSVKIAELLKKEVSTIYGYKKLIRKYLKAGQAPDYHISNEVKRWKWLEKHDPEGFKKMINTYYKKVDK